MRIVFLGDSLTEGVDGSSYLHVLAGMLAGDSRLQNTELINAGRGGDTILNLARRALRDSVPYAPDWVVIFVGVNDFRTWSVRRSFPTRANILSAVYFLRRKGIWRAVTPGRFSRGLRALVGALRAHTPARIALCTPATASESRDARAERLLDAYVARVRTVAAEQACTLIDVRAAFLAAEAHQRAATANGERVPLTIDGVHLSDAGAAVVAGVFRDWLSTTVTSGGAS